MSILDTNAETDVKLLIVIDKALLFAEFDQLDSVAEKDKCCTKTSSVLNDTDTGVKKKNLLKLGFRLSQHKY